MKITIEGKQGEGKTTLAGLLLKVFKNTALFMGRSIRWTNSEGCVVYKTPRARKFEIEIVEKIG